MLSLESPARAAGSSSFLPRRRRAAAVERATRRGGGAAAAANTCTLRPAAGGCAGLPASGLSLTRDAFTVGCKPPADVVVTGAGISAEHARFAWRAGRLYVTHLGSADGGATTFDSAPLTAGVAYLVGPGALIGLGSSAAFTVSFDGPAAAPGGVESMLLEAFKAKFAASANGDVRDALKGL